MAGEPKQKRATAFFDGQNLFHAVKTAFGYRFPNYDPSRLAQRICDRQGWTLEAVRFYTGVPSAADDPNWNAFWGRKLGSMSRNGVQVFSRSLK